MLLKSKIYGATRSGVEPLPDRSGYHFVCSDKELFMWRERTKDEIPTETYINNRFARTLYDEEGGY